MTAQVRSLRPEAEKHFIDALRRRYEEQGFAFTSEPDPKQLPRFFGSYVPDALAQKSGRNIVIELKEQPTSSTQRALSEIRRLFDGHADWQFRVFYTGTDPQEAETVAPASPDLIRKSADEVKALAAQGNLRAAFIVGWALLEAALRARRDGLESLSRKPGTVVQTLAMEGFIEPPAERRLRELIPLRNRIVHGDLTVEPTTAEIEFVLATIEDVLDADLS
ncbi:hypothetical protein [Methylorubrum extorquens]|uniref:hypothetical protein n=1 Tax=Methylorubrum extorquens TaxID=408 RepID=UPI0020A04120|nr:uncharacterized protein YutE (UPF0331/DUF86 family) [Methylorubrum extorquens]